MPTIMLRGLPADLVARLRTYAQQHALSLPEAASRLLVIALDHLAARAAGAAAVNATRTPEERQESAQHAARARWNRDGLPK